jgi:hypothetical protein
LPTTTTIIYDIHTLSLIIIDMPEDKFQVLLKEIDTDGSGNISFNEFAAAMKAWIQKKNELAASGHGDIDLLSVQQPVTHDGTYAIP